MTDGIVDVARRHLVDGPVGPVAQSPEVNITGYYTQDGMKDGEFVRITRNGEVYQMLQRYPVGDWVGVAIRLARLTPKA